MRKILFSLSIFLLASGAWDRVAAEVITEISYQYYPVPFIEGYTPKQMAHSASPLGFLADGRREVGQAKWKISTPNLISSQSPDGFCVLQNTQVIMGCLISLPRLEGDGSGRRQIDFDEYVEKIRRHEIEHCNIALRHAQLLDVELRGLGLSNCNGFKENLQAIYDRIVSDCKAEQIRFDELEPEID